ncbi:Zn(2)-C6 fungal-type domain-containing protein [Fusarium sp. LHS14.1]|nr:Zn(2)-C6 fungal-type domain-containing protein [Fusarium sp. LHS14.1]
MKRLGYKKSRKGCLRCKQRRVKCDEKVPCTACCRHGVPCSLEGSGSVTPEVPSGRDRVPARQQPSSSRSSSERSKEQNTPPTSDLFSCFSHFQFEAANNSQDPGWVSDIELTHHYTANAHRSLYSPCCHAYNVLQNDVPREGFSHPFLLHQLLAFSALHLAFLKPESRNKYLIQASQHQSVAISTMNSLLAKPLPSNEFHAMYATSIFVAISAFGTYPSCDRYQESFRAIDGLVDIFILIRGMNILLRSSGEELRNGPLKGLLSGCDCPPFENVGRLETVASKLGDLLPAVQDQLPLLDTEDGQLCVDTIAGFIETISMVIGSPKSAPTPELRVIFAWPMGLSNTFLSLLRSCEPLALVILSYYCVLLHSREPKYWFLQGWTNALIKVVVTKVVGTRWEELIQWPLQVIGENETPTGTLGEDPESHAAQEVAYPMC